MPDFAFLFFRRSLNQPWKISSSRGFARILLYGGPELSGMSVVAQRQPMSALKSSAIGRPFQSLDRTTVRTSCTKAKISSTHDRAFEHHLKDHGIHHVGCSQKPKLEKVLEKLSDSRMKTTLSLSQAGDQYFNTFLQRHWQAKDEAEVVAHVIPMIMDEQENKSLLATNKCFRSLKPLTNDTVPSAKPDFYYGASSEDLHSDIRSELAPLIIPGRKLPILPNFFLEAKGPDGLASVASRQARYFGAIGARSMHHIQNYRQEKPLYDDNAYTFSSTYHYGLLTLYAHHLTAPGNSRGRPEYHMTQLKSFALTSDLETFIRGVTAFRNLRDWAKRCRDKFISAANSKHPENATASEQGNGTGP